MRKVAVLLAVSGLLSVSAVVSAADSLPAAITCVGTVVTQRPMWQRVLSFGLLGGLAHEETKVGFPMITGGTDAIRELKSRNADLELIFSVWSERMSPQLVSSDFICTAANQKPMRLAYRKGSAVGDGKTIIADVDPLSK